MEVGNKSKKDNKWFVPVFKFGNDVNPPKKAPTEMENKNPLNACSKRDRASMSKCNPNTYSIEEVQSENWIDNFAPKDVSELGVNAKKIQELQDWLNKALYERSHYGSILLLSGPSGSGKTTAVQLITQAMKITLSEWVTPFDIEYVREVGANSYTFQEKQADKFLDFLLKASCYPSLLKNSNLQRILLVEDFPNCFLRDSSEFSNILQKYRERGKSPLIFICPDTRDGGLNMLWNLFPTDVQEKFNIDHISFNPCSTTLMKATLKRVTVMMSKKFTSLYQIPNQDCIDSIINSSLGDMRSAVNNLHFASLKGSCAIKLQKSAPKLEKKVEKATKRRKKDYKGSKLVSIGKDETLTILHGVGRVLNPKLVDDSDVMGNKIFTHSPESIVNHFLMQPVSFVGYIHENYLPHFSDIHHVERATDALSDADCFMNEWREKDGKFYGLTVAVRGLMLSNKTPVSSWHPLKGPKNMKIEYPTTRDIPLLNNNNLIQGKVLATDFKTYCQIISTAETSVFDIGCFDDDDDDDIFTIEDVN